MSLRDILDRIYWRKANKWEQEFLDTFYNAKGLKLNASKEAKLSVIKSHLADYLDLQKLPKHESTSQDLLKYERILIIHNTKNPREYEFILKS